jgi:hypothetical protein
MITAEKFKERTGLDPVNDDLERCNCDKAGELGHWFCGWCKECDKPRFICNHISYIWPII